MTEVPQMIKPDSNSGKVYVKRVSKKLLKYLKNENNAVAFKGVGADVNRNKKYDEKNIKNMEKLPKNTSKDKNQDETAILHEMADAQNEAKKPETSKKKRVDHSGKKEKEKDLKNEIDQKYLNALKTKRFNDKGDELYIQEYNNNGKIKCFVTEKGKKPSPVILSQSQFEDALKEYARVEKTIRKIIPANAAEKESVDHESGEQYFEKILGKEIVDKIIAIMQTYKKKSLSELEKDDDWKTYKKSTQEDIFEKAVKKTLSEVLDIFIKQKSITEKINEEGFFEYISKKIL